MMQPQQPIIPLFLVPGTHIGFYYEVVPGVNRTGRYGLVVSVKSHNGYMRDAVCKAQINKQHHDREVEILKAMQNTEGYPTFYDELTLMTNIPHYVCIISDNGATLHDVLQRSGRRMSNENVIRIGYQLFTIINRLHQKGYVHRDLHLLNILVKVGLDGELKLTIVDYGLARPSVPAPPSHEMLSYHASFQVSSGDAYTPMDDLTSIVINLMILSDIDPFGADMNWMLQRKRAFHASPWQPFFGTGREWIVGLYLETQRQREHGSRHAQLMNLFQEAIPGFDPSTPITFGFFDDENFAIL